MLKRAIIIALCLAAMQAQAQQHYNIDQCCCKEVAPEPYIGDVWRPKSNGPFDDLDIVIVAKRDGWIQYQFVEFAPRGIKWSRTVSELRANYHLVRKVPSNVEKP